MKGYVPAGPFYRALAAVKGAIATKATLPMLSHVRLRLAGDRLTVTGTDLGLELSSTVDARSEHDGAVAVLFERLLGLVKALPDGEVRLALDDQRLRVQAGRSRYALATLPGDEFPALEAAAFGPPVTLPCDGLAPLLRQTAYAMARDDFRYFLNGALLQIERGTVRLVASNGHRLALAEAEAEIDPAFTATVILPAVGILELAKGLARGGEVAVSFAPNAVRCGLEGLDLAVKLIEGRYPDWQRIVPRQFASTLTVDRLECLAAVRRVVVTAGDSCAVRLELSEAGVGLASENAQDAGVDSVAGQLEGEPQALGLNGDYLIDALEHLSGDRVAIGITPGGHSALLRETGSETAQHLIMAMRL